ncbi:radical SAM family heme chaperone HemW [Desulfobacter latus]|uniref:Heme chaperone HemW n=1 Tax=Desulfobacter latus TaxID=2292 RepID=A0A850T643_9BACT|nr:radical SAM family heme chaperone HemW [Desulfobacter latus]NWH04435.1 radical SAM family heme chaperone HemW [Desulfobacter latus]
MSDLIESEYLYIHVPFCIKKCRYCDFYSQTNLSLIPDYVTALVREIGRRSQSTVSHPKGNAATVYFGGGTPSLLGPRQLETILQALDNAFGLCPQTEITLEANPGTLDEIHLKSFQGMGINRVSLGFQSFDPAQLSLLGRIHSIDDAVHAVEKVRTAGIENISLDLIYGLPGQTGDHLIRELDAALVLMPAHLSCYMLTLEPGTILHAMHGRGKFLPMAKSDQVDLFRAAAKYLKTCGWDHYEVSNFATQTCLRSRHNRAYWQMVPYHGFGPAAHSYAVKSDTDGSAVYERFWNAPDLNGYINALKTGDLPPSGSEILTREQRQMEYVMVGLRTSMGLNIKTGQNLWQNRFLTVFQTLMEDLENKELARRRDAGQRFVLTLEGWMRLDSIIASFVEKI